MVFMDMRKRELLEARFVNEKVSLLWFMFIPKLNIYCKDVILQQLFPIISVQKITFLLLVLSDEVPATLIFLLRFLVVKSSSFVDGRVSQLADSDNRHQPINKATWQKM